MGRSIILGSPALLTLEAFMKKTLLSMAVGSAAAVSLPSANAAMYINELGTSETLWARVRRLVSARGFTTDKKSHRAFFYGSSINRVNWVIVGLPGNSRSLHDVLYSYYPWAGREAAQS